MSHFYCIAIVPAKTTNLENRLSRMMSPFSEKKKVKRYRKNCDCGEFAVIMQAREDATAKFGPFDNLRESFRNKEETKNLEFFSDAYEKAWKEHIKDWTEFEEARKAELLPEAKPKKDCSDCKGRGWYWSTYNPKSKWDWYAIGGRWTGHLDPTYDPTKDPDNIEICTLCKGTGTRQDMPVYEEGADPFSSKPIRRETAQCNGCNGTGKSVKFSFKEFPGDIQTVSRYLELLNEDKKYVPFALVTPKQEWYEKARMGWFAMTSDDKDEDLWINQVRSIVEQYKEGHVVVVVDVHI